MLRYGVLGLLIERRGYGYELVQRLAARLGAAWQLNPSAVYTALDQLEAAGLIEPVRVANGSERRAARRGERVVYRATERGVAEFEQWLARPSARLEPIRSELALKVALASAERVPALLAAVAHEEQLIVNSLRALKAGGGPSGPVAGGLSGPVAGGLSGPVAGGLSGPAGRVAQTLAEAEATLRMRCELEWLALVREALEQMQVQAVAAGAVTGRAATPAPAAMGRASLA